MLIYSMSVSVDGYIADRDGGIAWGGVPDEELFAFHLARLRGVGVHLCGRRLYEIMRVWETDPSFPDTDDEREFAAVWTALPKVVFSRTLDHVEGAARLASGSVADEVAAARAATDMDIEVGGADVAGQAFAAGLVEELHIFRLPVVVGGGTPYLPPVADPVEMELAESRTFGSRVVFERYRCG